MRIGNGVDVHRFVPGRPLILGGIEIPYDFGLEGHSDADVLLHAICDAILGALSAGDIGHHFPNTDPKWKDCASSVFLAECRRIAAKRGYRIVNIDATILAEEPRIAPHIPAMREKIAGILQIPENCVGLKATTTETLGFVGRLEGIVGLAVALLKRGRFRLP